MTPWVVADVGSSACGTSTSRGPGRAAGDIRETLFALYDLYEARRTGAG